MNWKCPQCGEFENTGDQMHCACGYEISDVQLALAKEEASRVLAAGTDQSKEEKEPDGFTYVVRTCEFAALILSIYFNYYAELKYRSILTSLSLFIFMALVITDSMHRKQISMKYHVVRKQDIPSMYNFFILLYFFMTLAILIKLIFEAAELY
ncbi:MAG: hypothetical protein A2075_06440 [Geobacteraceae bacterium GWC2_58_44]|nr:MAG: hypothetical protein A2075_06440 [Geobacteraceae bacterium GWC2_58_44]HBG05400.1 hypothetical protein [Geobacter sp.]